MFKEKFTITSLSLAVSLLSFQSDTYANVDKGEQDLVRVVNWEMSDYRMIDDLKRAGSPVVFDGEKITHEVGRGDTVEVILSKNGVSKKDTTNLIYNSKDSKKLSKLLIGQKIDLYKDGSELKRLVIHKRDLSSIVATKNGNSYIIGDKGVDFLVDEKQVSTKIKGTLSETLVRSGISANQAYKINDAFYGTVDLRKLRDGNTLNLVIEENIADNGKIIGYGDVLAVEIITDGVKHSAYLHKDGDSKEYYNAEGKSVAASFLRHPLDNVRITSPFNLKRIHPIFKQVAPHKGTDYGAPIGTPIYAAADGVAKTVGTQGGYGKVVILEHDNGYKTLYAHMSRHNIKRGSKVKQGDVIGYVGRTGYATGPHLHYELIKDGKHINSVTARLPEGKTLAGEQLAKFKGNVYDIAMRFEKVKGGGDYIIASNRKGGGKPPVTIQ